MKKKTAIFTVVSVAVLLLSWLIWDIYAISEAGTEGSISHLIVEWSYRYPLFTWGTGFVTGFFSAHFFWRLRDTKTTKRLSDESRKED